MHRVCHDAQLLCAVSHLNLRAEATADPAGISQQLLNRVHSLTHSLIGLLGVCTWGVLLGIPNGGCFFRSEPRASSQWMFSQHPTSFCPTFVLFPSEKTTEAGPALATLSLPSSERLQQWAPLLACSISKCSDSSLPTLNPKP